MSKKKKLLRKTRHTKTYDTETGPITEMEGITVTPDGNGIGEPATSDDMIPEGAELSDAERRELEARYGAMVMNSNMNLAGHVLGLLAMIPTYFSPVGLLAGAATGIAGLYNLYQNGYFLRMADIATNDTSLWDKTKLIAPIALETGLNTAMVVPGVGRVALYGIGRYGSGAMQQGARNYLVGRNFKTDIQPWQLLSTKSSLYVFDGQPYIQPEQSRRYQGITAPDIREYKYPDFKSPSEAAKEIERLNPGEVAVFKIPKEEAILVNEELPYGKYDAYHNGILGFFVKRVALDQTKLFFNYLHSYLSPDSLWYLNMLNNGYSKWQIDNMVKNIMEKAKYQNKYDWQKLYEDLNDLTRTEGEMVPSMKQNQININAFIMNPKDKIQKAIHEYLGHSIDVDAVSAKADPFTSSLVFNRIKNIDSIVDEILKSQKLLEFYNELQGSFGDKKFYTNYIFEKHPLYGYGEFRSRLLEHMNGLNSESVLTELREKGVITNDQWKRLMSHMAAIAPFVMYTQKKDED